MLITDLSYRRYDHASQLRQVEHIITHAYIYHVYMYIDYNRHVYVNLFFFAMEFHVNDSVRILVGIGFCLS